MVRSCAIRYKQVVAKGISLASQGKAARRDIAGHIITGGDDVELAEDGNQIGKKERYARSSRRRRIRRR